MSALRKISLSKAGHGGGRVAMMRFLPVCCCTGDSDEVRGRDGDDNYCDDDDGDDAAADEDDRAGSKE